MSSNPPIMAVPPLKADPYDRVSRYRVSQQRYARYHADLGIEEIATPLAFSFRNHLPPTPDRLLMLSEAGSTSSRSKGIVARMKPRHEDGRVPLQPGVSEATEIVITDDFQINPAKPTPVVPGGLKIPKTTAYAGIESVAIRKKRPASRTRIKSESKRIKAEGEIKETESQAQRRQRRERRSAKAAILKPKHTNTPTSIQADGSCRDDGEGLSAPRPMTKRDGQSIHGINQFRSIHGVSATLRARGSVMANFRPNNVGGHGGRITLGFLNKGMTSGKVKIGLREDLPSGVPDLAFSESAFFNRPAATSSSARKKNNPAVTIDDSYTSADDPPAGDVAPSRMSEAEYALNASKCAPLPTKRPRNPVLREITQHYNPMLEEMPNTKNASHALEQYTDVSQRPRHEQDTFPIPILELFVPRAPPSRHIDARADTQEHRWSNVSDVFLDHRVSHYGNTSGLNLAMATCEEQPAPIPSAQHHSHPYHPDPPFPDLGASSYSAIQPAQPVLSVAARLVHKARRRRVPPLPKRRRSAPGHHSKLPGKDVMAFLNSSPQGYQAIQGWEEDYVDELSLDSFEAKLWATEAKQVEQPLNEFGLMATDARGLWHPRRM